MTYLRMPRLVKNTQKSGNPSLCRWFFGLLAVLMAGFLTLTACGCFGERGIKISVENQTASDVAMVYELIKDNGEHFGPWTLETVPAGQTVDFFYDLKSSADHLFKAEDPSGKIVWQHIWTVEEIRELAKVGWKIVISPQTDSPP